MVGLGILELLVERELAGAPLGAATPALNAAAEAGQVVTGPLSPPRGGPAMSKPANPTRTPTAASRSAHHEHRNQHRLPHRRSGQLGAGKRCWAPPSHHGTAGGTSRGHLPGGW
ncbi:hypothetical protein GCM10020229_09750 [Kitasatospora albolonga]